MPYHKGYTKDEARAAHCEQQRRYSKKDEVRIAHRDAQRRYSKTASIEEVKNKEVIVWDGEGMNLSGTEKPQHYVLFGCSARPDNPLIIDNPQGRLRFEEIADYCMDVVNQHPNAIHLGYYFTYDQNMIIWSLPWLAKHALYYKNACVVNRGDYKYYVRMIPRKFIRITRIHKPTEERTSILFEDIATFFGTSFVAAYESLFPTPTDPENWEIVKQGKAVRSVMEYKDLERVRRYWRAEIMAFQELAVEFRRIMFNADFFLREWHGPGALANYVRKENDLIRHEWGGKEENLMPEVHEAIKGAFFGGHVEQYRVGYVEGPIYHYDRNSAYPTAFCEVPTLAKGGQWRNVGPISYAEYARNKWLRTSFAVFKIEWSGSGHRGNRVGAIEIQPFPHRDSKKNISFPTQTVGWYWAPEVEIAVLYASGKTKILDGWVWDPIDDDLWPWENVIRAMYKQRAELKRDNNPSEKAFKLAMNSLYGKSAQRAGGKEQAPKSHTLCIAGYVTSSCRASVADFMYACPPDTVISIETDGIFTTAKPEELKKKYSFGKDLGEWGITIYDEMVILQNGVYLLKKDGKWLPPKSRGINARHFQDENGKTDPEPILKHLSECTATEPWEPIIFDGGQSFIGLGTSIARASRIIKDGPCVGQRMVNPFKAADLHCTWYSDGKTTDLEGLKSKRRHYSDFCRACVRGETPDISWHDMRIQSLSDKHGHSERESTIYMLPWEKEYVEEEWHQDMKDAEGVWEIHL